MGEENRGSRCPRGPGTSGRLLSVVLLSVLFASCGSGGPRPDPGTPCESVTPRPFALWSEFLSPAEVREQVPRMKRHGLSLYQNIRSTDIGDPDVAALLSFASCRGLEVRAWLTLPEDQGYWPNEKNADLFAEKALALAQWIRASGWAVDWIVVDMEPDLQMMEALMAMLGAGDVAGAVDLLLGNLDPEAFSRAAGKFTELVDTLHALGFQVMVVTFPLVLDDRIDGDATVEDLLNTPVDGIPWDELSFMAYTTVFSQFLGGEVVTPYLAYSYGLDAVKYYPDRGALDLGVIGHPGMTGGEGITDLEAFRAQVAAAKQAGLQRVHAYSLDGIVLEMPDPDLWFDALQTPSAPVPEQEAVDLFRWLIQLLDRLVEKKEVLP
jgi:hypothetical protein